MLLKKIAAILDVYKRQGKNVHFGNGVYANFNLTMVDDCDIFVGNNVLFGPNVTVSAGTHPIHPELRSKQAQYNISIHIGNNVWIDVYKRQASSIIFTCDFSLILLIAIDSSEGAMKIEV